MEVIRLARVHWWDEQNGSGGYSFFRSEPEARAAIREAAPDASGHKETVEIIEIEPTVDGILAAMQKYASHADNG